MARGKGQVSGYNRKDFSLILLQRCSSSSALPIVPLVGKLCGHSFSRLAVGVGMDYFYPETRTK